MLAVLSTSHLSIAPVDSVALWDHPTLPSYQSCLSGSPPGEWCSKCESLNVQERRRKNSRNVQSQVFLQNKMSNWAREKPQVTSFLRNSFPRQKSILYTLIIHHSAWHLCLATMHTSPRMASHVLGEIHVRLPGISSWKQAILPMNVDPKQYNSLKDASVSSASG